MLSLLDFPVEQFGAFPVPAGLQPGNLRDQCRADPSLAARILDRPKRSDPPSAAVAKRLATLPPARFGLKGIYQFVAEFWDPVHTVVPKLTDFLEEETFRRLYAFGAISSYRTPSTSYNDSTRLYRALGKYVHPAQEFVRLVVKCANSGRAQSKRADARFADTIGESLPPSAENLPFPFAGWVVYWAGGNTVFVDPTETVCYAFTPNDIERIERLFLGFAYARFYCATFSATETKLNDRLLVAANSIISLYINAFRNLVRADGCLVNGYSGPTPGGSFEAAQLICRASDVILHWYQGSIATSVNTWALDRQKAKYADERLAAILPAAQFLRIVSQFKLREALELLSIHKALPSTDMDYFGAAHRQTLLWGKDRAWGVQVENERTGPYSDLLKYYKWTLIRAYHAKHGVCPGRVRPGVPLTGWHAVYPTIDPVRVPFDRVDDLELTGTFGYRAHGVDCLDLVGDKAMCPTNIASLATSSELGQVPLEQKNYLLDVLTRPVPLNVRDAVTDREARFRDVRAEDKAEAKKPNGRMFFELHTEERIVQSEYEESVAEYARTAVGCMSGKGVRDTLNEMNRITEPLNVGLLERYRVLMVSFDLDKFSPSLRSELHRDTDAINADLFGLPELADAYRLYEEGDVHYIRRRIHHVIPKMGRDYEGMSGRKNTLWHTALMGYAIRRMRTLGLLDRGGRFATLIDDGILRLMVDAEHWDTRVPEILAVLEEVYALGSCYISWDKTYLDELFSVFLNDVRYGNVPVAPGLRAFVRISSRSEAIVESMPDNLETLAATARGALTSGATYPPVYAMYLYHVADLCRKWGDRSKVKGNALPLYAFVPVQLGGLGLHSFQGLQGAVGSVSYVEGISNLRAIAFRIPELRPAIQAVVNQPMAQLSRMARLRAPTSVRREARVLRSTRAQIAIERSLRDRLQSPVVQALLGGGRAVIDEAALDRIFANGVPPAPVLDAIYASSVDKALAQLSAKVLRSRTAERLAPRKALQRASRANATEARLLLADYLRG